MKHIAMKSFHIDGWTIYLPFIFTDIGPSFRNTCDELDSPIVFLHNIVVL